MTMSEQQKLNLAAWVKGGAKLMKALELVTQAARTSPEFRAALHKAFARECDRAHVRGVLAKEGGDR